MIPLIKSTFYHEKQTKKELCDFIMKADKLSIGSQCLQFERNFAAYQGKKHCIFLNSGSSANLALIQALVNLGKLKRGDSVGFSAVTWSTNVMPLIQLGLVPIPIDVELDTLNVSSAKLLQVLKHHRLKMVFLTNLLGFCDDIDKITNICKKRKIIFIEDNCESLGTVYKGRKLGNWGLASTVSFYVGHHMSTVEGGGVITDSDTLDTMLQLVRAHGWDRNLTERRQLIIRLKHNVNSTFYSRYTFYDLGYNFRTTEIQGFLGNCQLRYLGEIIKRRQINFLQIIKQLNKRNDIYYPLRYSHLDVVSNFAIPIVCKTQKIRDALVKKCDGIVEIRPIVGGDMTNQPFFKKYVSANNDNWRSSNARIVHEQGLYFGNNPELTRKEISQLIHIFTR